MYSFHTDSLCRLVFAANKRWRSVQTSDHKRVTIHMKTRDHSSEITTQNDRIRELF